MRAIITILCLCLAGCGAPPVSNDTGSASAPGLANAAHAPSGAPRAPETAAPDDTAPDINQIAAESGGSTLATECAAVDSYPDGKVRPAFYAYPEPLEFERYRQCVDAETERDGGRKRLASARSFPKVGTCYDTHVTEVAGRLGGAPGGDMGTSVSFGNKLHLVEYAAVPAAIRSRPGDAVRACVVELPQDCPADDLRGIVYRVANLRTRESWEMSDSQHLCRGA